MQKSNYNLLIAGPGRGLLAGVSVFKIKTMKLQTDKKWRTALLENNPGLAAICCQRQTITDANGQEFIYNFTPNAHLKPKSKREVSDHEFMISDWILNSFEDNLKKIRQHDETYPGLTFTNDKGEEKNRWGEGYCIQFIADKDTIIKVLNKIGFTVHWHQFNETTVLILSP